MEERGRRKEEGMSVRHGSHTYTRYKFVYKVFICLFLPLSHTLSLSLSISVCLSLSLSLSFSHTHTLSLSFSLSPSFFLSSTYCAQKRIAVFLPTPWTHDSMRSDMISKKS